MGVGVDNRGRRADALQADRLPHHQHLVVGALRDNDHVTRLSGIDGRLDGRASGQHRGLLAADGHGDRIDRSLARRGCDDELAALGWRAPIDRLLLHCTVRHTIGHRHSELSVRPRPDRCSNTADCNFARGSSKAVMARDLLLVVRGRGGGRSAVAVPVDRLVAQRRDGQRMSCRADPRTGRVTDDAGHGRCRVRKGAIWRVIAARGERLHRHNRRVEVPRLTGHERQLIAELTVARLEQRIRRRAEACIVHAHGHHRRGVARRVGRIDFPRRVIQAVVQAELVRIDAVDRVAAPVFDTDRHVCGCKFLAELRRERIKFGREVVQDDALEVRGHVRGAEEVELRQRRALRIQRHFLAIAQRTEGTGERSNFQRLREQADVVGHLPHFAHAGPVGLNAAGVAFMAGQRRVATQVGGRILRIQRVIGFSEHRLVGQDVDGTAETRDLHRGRRDVVVANQNVLVLFLHKLIARRDDHFDDILARRQHRRAEAIRIGLVRIGRASGAIGAARLAGRRVKPGRARKAVHTVVRRRLQLVPGVHTVVALVLCAVRQRGHGRTPVLRFVPVEVLRLVIQGIEERIATGRRRRSDLLTRAIHVGLAVRAETLRPIVPARGVGLVNQLQRLRHTVGGHAFLIQVDVDVRDQRLPAQLQQQLRVVERSGRGVYDVAVDRAGLIRCEGLLAPLQEVALSNVTLPAVGAEPERRVDTAGRIRARRARLRAIGDALAHAVRIPGRAIHRARHRQVGRQRVLLIGIREARGGLRGAAGTDRRIARG